VPEPADVAVAFGLLNNSGLNGRRITIEIEPSMKNGKARNRGVAADGAYGASLHEVG
jgi:hypothetical protein